MILIILNRANFPPNTTMSTVTYLDFFRRAVSAILDPDSNLVEARVTGLFA